MYFQYVNNLTLHATRIFSISSSLRTLICMLCLDLISDKGTPEKKNKVLAGTPTYLIDIMASLTNLPNMIYSKHDLLQRQPKWLQIGALEPDHL